MEVVLTRMDPPSRSLSRASSVSSIAEEASASKNKKRKRHSDQDAVEMANVNRSVFEEIRAERSALEEFLFNEANKVNKNIAKFVLTKWAILEARLQEEMLEKEKAIAAHKECASRPSMNLTYAQATSAAPVAPRQRDVNTRKEAKKKSEVVIIKPKEDTDKRTNDEIRKEVTDLLKKDRKALKVRNIRQLRTKGMLIEVQSNEDVKMIKEANLDQIGLSTSRPQKIDPTLMIYDVEKEWKPEELREEFMAKNFDNISKEEKEKLGGMVKFRHAFKTKNASRVNWIVQIPAKLFGKVVDEGRVFMLWRTYKVREYINIARCYKCHMYGHVAKYCSVQKQICETCGDSDHTRDNCKKKEDPQCPVCIRHKRKDVRHSLRSKTCPEYLRQVELYNQKIQWT